MSTAQLSRPQVSPLQRRLRLASTSGVAGAMLIENVPRWPGGPPLIPLRVARTAALSYAPAEGLPELRDAVVHREQRVHRLEVCRDEVLVTAGGCHALTLLFHELWHPGARALCQYPLLDNIGGALVAAGYQIDWFRVDDGRLNLAEVAEAVHADTAVVYVNSPHNPTGEVCRPQTLGQLRETASQVGAVLIHDAVYDTFCFPAGPAPLAGDPGHGVVIVNSMSKNYGMPGLRIGWLLAPAELVERVTVRLEHEQIAIPTAGQLQAAAVLAFDTAPLVEAVQEGFAASIEAVAAVWPQAPLMPRGGTQLWLPVPTRDLERLADELAAQHGIALVTSSNYLGDPTPHVRLPVTIRPDALAAAVRTLRLRLETPNPT